MLSSLPSPSEGVFHLGPLPLRMYGIMIAIGVIAGLRLGEKETVRLGGEARQFASAATWGVVAGLIGARLYHVATAWEDFSGNLGDIPKIWQGGLGVPGGLLAGIVVGLWRGHRLGVPVSLIATAAAPALPLAQAIGRWGNWWNQELFGRPTDLPWGLRIDPENRPAAYADVDTFHPTFLYESLYNVALCVVLLLVSRRARLKPGRLMALYVAGYAFGRFFIEGLRIDEAKSGGGLRLNQWTALAAFTVSVGFLVLFGLRDRTPAVVGAASDESETDAAESQPDQSEPEPSEPDDYVADHD